jgi:hypothetical protein
MKTNLLFRSLLLLFLTLIFFSCKKELETTDSAPPEVVLPAVEAIPAETNTAPETTVAPPVQTQAVTVNNQVSVQQPVPTKLGMNPPHGQPGHRCDIPVGAPLNSPVNTPSKTGTATTQRIDPSAITPTSTSQPNAAPAILDPNAAQTITAPGMNPPHGQPGHQCGIAVGAPLPK